MSPEILVEQIMLTRTIRYPLTQERHTSAMKEVNTKKKIVRRTTGHVYLDHTPQTNIVSQEYYSTYAFTTYLVIQ